MLQQLAYGNFELQDSNRVAFKVGVDIAGGTDLSPIIQHLMQLHYDWYYPRYPNLLHEICTTAISGEDAYKKVKVRQKRVIFFQKGNFDLSLHVLVFGNRLVER